MPDEMDDIIHENFEGLTCPVPGEPHYPWVYATLKIDTSLLSEDQVGVLMEARGLMQSVGVNFDFGMGGGVMDWELDWSLRGAWIEARPVYCAHCREPIAGEAIWVTSEHWVGDDSLTAEPGEPLENPFWNRSLKAFCSAAHVEAEKARWDASKQEWRVIVTETAEVGVRVR